MERLSDTAIEIINDLHTERLRYYNEYVPLINAANKLAAYEDLEEQGLLLRLPCKVGDTIYVLDRDGQPRRMIMDKPDLRCHCSKEDNFCMALCDRKNTGVCAYRFCNDGSDIGKTVFLTQEEAEKKLKEMEKVEKR